MAWTPEHQRVVWGHPNPANPITFNTVIQPSRDPSRSCPGLEAEQVYDPQTNPKGVRCSLQDYMVAVFGKRRARVDRAGEDRRRVRRAAVGQHGRRVRPQGAASRGKITPDAVRRRQREGRRARHRLRVAGGAHRGRPARARARVPQRRGQRRPRNLDKVAIIDLRGPDPGAFHDVYRTYAMRARLDREHGHHRNQVLWRGQVVAARRPGLRRRLDRRDGQVARRGREGPARRPARAQDRRGQARPTSPTAAPTARRAAATCRPRSATRVVAELLDRAHRGGHAVHRRHDQVRAQAAAALELLPGAVQRRPVGASCRRSSRTASATTPSPASTASRRVPWLTLRRTARAARALGPAPRSCRVAGALGAPPTRRCVSRRRFRHPAARAARRAAALGARVRQRPARQDAPRRGACRRRHLRGLPRGVVRVRIVAMTRSGRRLELRRRYRICGA